MDHILHQIFKTIIEYIVKKHYENIGYPSVKMYVNKIENRSTFKS